MSLNVFPVPSGTETSQIATGHDGSLYFTEPSADKIGRISPAGVVTEFAVPTPNALPENVTAGPDGNVYFTETGATRSGVLQIGRITPAGKISEFSLGGSVFEVGGIAAGPDGNVYASISTGQGEGVARITAAGTITDLQPTEGFTGINAGSITAGPDGNLWFTDPDNRQIVRTTPAGIFTAFALPANSVTGSQAGGITAGPDGNLWFTGNSAGSFTSTAFIGRITTHGVVTEFPVPLTSGYLATITAGSDGNLYFSESEQIPNLIPPGAGIGRITTQGVVTEFAVPSSGGIAAGPDGNIWVTQDGKIGQFVLDGKPVNPNVNQFAVPSGAETSQIATGHDGNLYFTETSADKIGRISPGGVVTEFAVPTPNALPGTITAGPDGNVYFTETGANRFGDQQIGRITSAGKITEFSLGGTVFEVGGITAGPDGNVYFSATTTNGFESVGRIAPTGTITLFTMPVGFDAGAITTGHDGNIWATDPDDNLIVRMTPAGKFTTFALQAGSGSLTGGATAGPDGNVWFTGTSFIGRITPTGVVTEFPLSTKDSNPASITSGSDGNLYFASSSPGGDIGRITTQGVITEIPVPASGGVAAGPDGNIWLTEDGKIAQLVLPKPGLTSASAPKVASAAAVANDVAVEALFPGGDTGSDDAAGGAPTVALTGSPGAKHKKA